MSSVVARSPDRVSKFLVPEIVFGHGALSEAGFAARRLDARRVFIVTDPGIVEAGWLTELQQHLDDVDLPYVVWHGVTPNPKDHEVAAGHRSYRESGADVIIGLGGGSVIDAAKAIAVLSTNGGQILDYEGVDRVTQAIPPLIMIPSTFGDWGGSVSVLRHHRHGAADQGDPDRPGPGAEHLHHRPRLLVTMPEELNAATGLDALTHGIEAYVSRAASPLTDVHALTASDNLLQTMDLPEDTDARAGMAQASLEAGLAFTNAILGATHAMSHQVGGALDLPHGVLNGVLLPHVMRFNAGACPERFVPVAQTLGVSVDRLSAQDAAYAAADRVREMADSVGVPKGLGDLGVTAEDIDQLSINTLGDACLTTNPRDASQDEISAIFRAAL